MGSDMDRKILSIIENNLPKLTDITPYEKRTFSKLLLCRTEKLPGIFYSCDHCGIIQPVYKSCKNRMCPYCNGGDTLKWVAKREQELLPVNYFFLSYTVTSKLRPLFLLNKKICYNLLFKAVSESLKERIKKGFRGFQGKAGFIAVLHTWNQRIFHHPHIHVIIPAGCLSDDNTQWNSSKPFFFLPIWQLSADFKKKLLSYLRKEGEKETLIIPKDISDFNSFLDGLEYSKWVVNSQPPKKRNSKPEYIVRYLSRYVKKTAISDKRIIKVENGFVHFKYFDRDKHQVKREVVSEERFLRRYALHILPKGFKKVRFYGFMACRSRLRMLHLCRFLLGIPLPTLQDVPDSEPDVVFLFWKYFGIDIALCPECHKGHMVLYYTYDKGG